MRNAHGMRHFGAEFFNEIDMHFEEGEANMFRLGPRGINMERQLLDRLQANNPVIRRYRNPPQGQTQSQISELYQHVHSEHQDLMAYFQELCQERPHQGMFEDMHLFPFRGGDNVRNAQIYLQNPYSNLPVVGEDTIERELLADMTVIQNVQEEANKEENFPSELGDPKNTQRKKPKKDQEEQLEMIPSSRPIPQPQQQQQESPSNAPAPQNPFQNAFSQLERSLREFVGRMPGQSNPLIVSQVRFQI